MQAGSFSPFHYVPVLCGPSERLVVLLLGVLMALGCEPQLLDSWLRRTRTEIVGDFGNRALFLYSDTLRTECVRNVKKEQIERNTALSQETPKTQPFLIFQVYSALYHHRNKHVTFRLLKATKPHADALTAGVINL